MNLSFIFIFLLLSATNCVADNNIASIDKPDRGWFWYEHPEDEEEPKKPASPVVQQPVTKEIKKEEKKPMSVEYLRKMYPKIMDMAQNNPTRENIAALLYVQRIMLDQAQRFAEMGREVAMTDPMLDENNRLPTISLYGKNEFMEKHTKDEWNALKYISKNVGGLFFFFDSKCSFCKAQLRIIKMVQESYGFNVTNISMDGKPLPGIDNWVKDNGHAELLNLKVYPTIVLAVPPKSYFIVAQGMMAKDQLEQRILLAANSNKLLPEDMIKDINPWDRGVLTTEDMQDGASEDPQELMKYVKNKLKNRY